MIPEGLSNKRVLVTAGGSGIGRTIAQAFQQQGAGVFVCDVDAAALEKMSVENPGIATAVADVAEERDVEALFTTMLDNLGGLDVLVNNAGIAGPAGYLEDLSPAEWRRCLSVNLDGGFLCARQALPIMKAQGLGCIINMASNAGIMGFPMRTPYAAAKWAVVGLTKSLAMEA
ncbi:MAG: SDR family NAD(P)-dependent oxidoreductase, partial [Alphaproteobacteria bacterium]|nr:SDR family NAD(P)-dependent oxidoreductase [Alphaproteobacteria bacterium]